MPRATNSSQTVHTALGKFREANHVTSIGALGTVLVVTRRASGAKFPLDVDALLTPGGGQGEVARFNFRCREWRIPID